MLWFLAAVGCLGSAAGQDTCQTRLTLPKQYIAYHTSYPLVIDGRLDDEAWQEVPWTTPFVDISTDVTPRFETHAKIRWDDNFLYVGARLQEPDVWANVTKHNEVIFHDNDFEVFVGDGSNHNYKEFEMNAINQTWDLLLNKPYDDGGFENSTRTQNASGWEMQPPLHCATFVDGRVNDPTDARPNKYWSAEIALPLRKLAQGWHDQPNVPPLHGDFWRINFSRVEWRVVVVDGQYQRDPAYPHEDNWVWSAQGSIAMHLPERWGILQFSKAAVNASQPVRPADWAVRSVAMDLYYAQHAFKSKYGHFTQNITDLQPLAPNALLDGECGVVAFVTTTQDAFEALVRDVSCEGVEVALQPITCWVATIRNDRLLTTALLG